jgi:hypothetical protein
MPRQRGLPTVDGVGPGSEPQAGCGEDNDLDGARHLARERDIVKVRVLISSLPLLAVTVVACTLAVAHASGGSEKDPAIASSRIPDWFLPIADAYDRNPAVTPNTDFAVLHFGSLARPPELVEHRR